MTEPYIQVYLLACVTVSMAILFWWSSLRRKFRINSAELAAKSLRYQRVGRVGTTFWLIFLVFVLMVIIYATFPSLYFVFLPLDIFHQPLINLIGMLVTKIAIGWIIVAQLHIDKELTRYLRDIESLAAMEMVAYSEGLLLTGMLLFFAGIFITITNVVGLILLLFGLYHYLKKRTYHTIE